MFILAIAEIAGGQECKPLYLFSQPLNSNRNAYVNSFLYSLFPRALNFSRNKLI